MEKTNFNFSVGSDFDYEDLIADIGYDNQLVAILTQEEGFENMKITIYCPKDADCWNFRLDEFEKIIHKAKKRLWELRKVDDESSTT